MVSSVLTVQTQGAGFIDLTHEAGKFLSDASAGQGALTLFIRHTSASLTIQENADPSVLDDLMTALDRLAPQDAGWAHDAQGPGDKAAHVRTMLTAASLQVPVHGPDDMPAHVRTMLTAASLQVPVLNGKLALGTWQ